MPANTVVAIVRGGVVQEAYADEGLKVHFRVIDVDDLKEDGYDSEVIDTMIELDTARKKEIPIEW